MKKLLYFYLALQVSSSIVCFFTLLQFSFIYAIIIIAASLLGIIIPVSILKNMENIQQLQSDIHRLRCNLNELEKIVQGEKDEKERAIPLSGGGEIAVGNWKCIKCGTVNKVGTSRCMSCKAAYSSEENPTDDPSKKKKYNRWGI